MANEYKPPNLQNLFGGVQYVAGLGYVGAPVPNALNGAPQLGDDASVMMISGLGAADDQRQVQVDAQGNAQSVAGAGFSLRAALQQPVTIASVTLPLWAWLLIAAGVIGVAGYYFLLKKK